MGLAAREDLVDQMDLLFLEGQVLLAHLVELVVQVDLVALVDKVVQVDLADLVVLVDQLYLEYLKGQKVCLMFKISYCHLHIICNVFHFLW
jgi:hypothetical protein